MKLEQQVCSLELAERLKELGVKQESLFCWKHNTLSPDGPINEWVISQFPGRMSSDYFIAAFTAAELGEMLPPEINGFVFRHEKYRDKQIPLATVTRHSVGYYELGHEDEIRFEARYGDSDTEVYARMLIYLLENKLVKDN